MTSVVAQSHYIFGLRTGVSNNLCFFDEQTVVFPSGNNCVCYNMVQGCQRFIPGWRVKNYIKISYIKKVFAFISEFVLLCPSFYPFVSLQAQRKARACKLWPSAPIGVTWQCQSVARRPPSQCLTYSTSRAERERF